MVTDVGCAFDDVVAGESEITFSDGQWGLSYGLVSQVGLGLTSWDTYSRVGSPSGAALSPAMADTNNAHSTNVS